ncbi:MAG: DnaJ C-terminal domain-containing protein [Asticcacaulis sp.]
MPFGQLEENERDPARADALIELGLTGPASDEEVRAAFRARLKDAHPDLNGGTDVLLRRLILARDLLIQNVKTEAHQADNQRDLTDAALPLHISLAQALHGGEAVFATRLTESRVLRVHLPAGLREGERLKLPCAGEDVSYLFIVNIDSPSGVRVVGDDIWTSAAIEARVFFSGGRAEIATPWGPREIEIGRAFPRGSSLCLKGLGLPQTDSHAAGHLYVRLEERATAPRRFVEAINDFRQKWAS